MGGSQSSPTRKLTIPNEESNIIKVSESVAERLRRCTEKSPEDFINAKKLEPEECPPTDYVRNKENIAHYPGDPLLNFYYGPSVTSIRILQEKEKELKESEDYWTKRIQNMEMQHGKLNNILENEYNKAIQEISSQSARPPPNTPFPCCEQKEKLIECYKKNPNEILLCAGEVTEFADCVHSRRIYPNKDTNNECEDKEKKEDKNKKTSK